jgi:vitamin B12 transporter
MVDIGIDQRLESGRAAWSATWFDGVADDGIFSIFNPATGKSSPQNIQSPVDMSGVELDLRLSPVSWLDRRGAYTYLDVSQRSVGTQLFGRPRHEASAAVTVRPVSRLALTLDGYWREYFFSDYPSTYEMPGYALFSLAAVWDITDAVKLSARIQNAGDKTYEEKLGDATYGRTAQVRLSVRY